MRSESTTPKTRHYPVTPTLFVGPVPDGGIRVETVKQAVSVIESGGTAVLPEGAWKDAEKVVAKVTSSRRLAHRKVALAKTGRLV